MQILDWVRFGIGLTFLILGVLVMIVQVFGIFRFKYVLNRMHSAAMGDTAGIGLCILGLAIFAGFSFVTLKLFLVVAFLWCASPVSSHLISKLEMTINPDFEKECEIEESAEEEIKKENEKLSEKKGEV
ncbi:MAG: monovalent cation/H(+) antiporter subunit G [Eubacteriales bacterium]|nr:monovalent cation/H(+) antiporter subunit G [Eubacteriales bacterium]